ncbi:MAG: amidohydrolase [Deltaproteobacteria bacterium]|jgi:predicted TIM-barrel fold metal-dependent hydrolase|nr:amidohydrolase [Deltaproteobacteria bacterium]
MSSAQRLISADDHVDLSHDQIKSFLASKFHADYDQALGRFGAMMASTLSAEANNRWREQEGLEAESGQDMLSMSANRTHAAFGRPGHVDPKARIEDLDTDGIDASVLYSEVSAFRYLYMLENGAREATRAFNTALSEFASLDPKRLVVSYQIPIHDIDVAIAEVQWAAAQGGKSLQLPLFPAELGLPDYWDQRYDPLWAAIQEADLPVCCHIGLNTQLEDLAKRDPTPQKGIFVPSVAFSTSEAFGMFIMGGVFEKFPDLRVVFVEPGLGWVAWWLYITDDMVTRQDYVFPAIKERPSHYFHRNVYLTFIDEPDAYRHASERLGIDNIMWSSDYPHPVSSWPRSREIVDEMFADVPAADREKIVCGNAERVWKL